MPLIETTGAASSRGFGQFAKTGEAVYIESVFQTWLYTGNNSTNTITNGVDLSGKGGLVWLKNRGGANPHTLWDTARGVRNYLVSNTTAAQVTSGATEGLYQWNNNGFTLGTNYIGENSNGFAYASWTFRKQPKFFDVVTWTGNGTGNRTISHNLGSVPGCIITKKTSATGNWFTFHRSVNAGRYGYGVLNGAVAFVTGTGVDWNPTATTFEADADLSLNDNAATYVAYLFAHDAGGFGLSGTDNVISCGSYTGNGSTTGPVVTLGYEPQWLLIKYMNGPNDGSGDGSWQVIDNMRGMPVGAADSTLQANSSAAETSNEFISPTATGFQVTSSSLEVNVSGKTYIYIAIRRGPMKTPTTGTSVFSPRTSAGSTSITNVGFPPDLIVQKAQNTLNPGTDPEAPTWVDRLRGAPSSSIPTLFSSSTAAETTGTALVGNFYGGQQQYTIYAGGAYNLVDWIFRRAPGFFDVVCYTGTGANRTVNHNLGAVPEMMIVKQRDTARDWVAYIAPMGNNYFACLNDGTFQGSSSTMWNDTTPTASVFTVGTNIRTNTSAGTYVAYLFATVAGVSKVGSYTGTGTTLQINCGFTGGARFVLIKRTDSTGDWYVWDSARGIVAGNDPYLLLNSTAAEVTSTDYVDTFSSGFEISSTAPAAINANGGTFIYLAIA